MSSPQLAPLYSSQAEGHSLARLERDPLNVITWVNISVKNMVNNICIVNIKIVNRTTLKVFWSAKFFTFGKD